MPIRTILSIALLWVLSLVVAVSIVKAQVFEPVQPWPIPRIIAGPDFGLRVEGDQKGTPVGTLVVRVNGKWIEARVGRVEGLPRSSR